MIWDEDKQETVGIERTNKNGISTITYVQLVRCKDCKYGSEPILAYRKGCVWCERVNRHNDADWFCADGKRQEGR